MPKHFIGGDPDYTHLWAEVEGGQVRLGYHYPRAGSAEVLWMDEYALILTLDQWHKLQALVEGTYGLQTLSQRSIPTPSASPGPVLSPPPVG